MSEERLNTFRTFEKKMEDGSVVVCCESSIESKELIEQIQESLRVRPVHMIFDKLPEEVKTEIQRTHLEMVLNSDFKPIYVNVAPNAPIHKVNFETEAKTPKEECT
jgi:hypothetical protein